MKVLFVLEHYHPYIGGAEKLFKSICEGLVKSGFEITVITTKHQSDLADEEMINGVKVMRMPVHNRYLFTFFSGFRVSKEAANYDLIHTTSYNAAVPARLAAVLRKKPISITVHEVWDKLWWQLPFTLWPVKAGYYWFEQMMMRFQYDRVVCVSHATAAAITKAFPGRHIGQVIYNGMDYSLLEKYKHQVPQTFTFCYFGRLGTSKGLDMLIEAAAMFKLKQPKSKFRLIIPSYPKHLFQAVQQMIKRLQLEDYIELLQHLSEEALYEAVSSSSVVVIPSLSEGFCFTAAEAAAMGVPIIHSNRGSLPEVVSGKQIALSSLTAEAIAEALEMALQNRYDSIPNKHFDIQPMIDGYAKLFRELGMKK
jgi:glycosyltransferase involved in cell wall biosynthesis